MGLLHLTPFEGGRIDALHKEIYSIRAIAKKQGYFESGVKLFVQATLDFLE